MRSPQSDRRGGVIAHHYHLHANLRVLLVLAVFCCGLQARAQHVGNYSKVLTEGEPTAAAARGPMLYLGAGSNLVVMNLDSLGIPRVESQIDMCSLILDIALQGTRAFVLCKSGALSVVDVSSDNNPQERFRIDIPGIATSLAVSDNRIAVASDEIIVLRCDSSTFSLAITNSYPFRASRVAMNNWFIHAVSPDSLIILGWEAGELQRAGWLTVPAATDVALMDVALTDTLAFVTHSDSPRLSVVNFSRPDDPTILGTAPLTTASQDFTLDYQDGLICIAGPALGIATVRLKESGQPTVLATYPLQGMQPRAVTMEASKAYVPCGVEGLRVVNLANPANPSLVEEFKYDRANDPRRVVFDMDTCFVADGHMGLVCLNASDPRGLEFVQSLPPPRGGLTNSVALNGSLIRTAEGPALFRAISRHLPFQTYYDSDSTGLCFNDLAVSGSYLYVADGTIGLRILDATDTTNFQQVAIPISGLGAVDVCASDNLACLAMPDSGLRVVDVTTPTDPHVMFTWPCSAYAAAISGSTLYIAAGSDGVIALDVAIPQTPVPLFTYPTPSPAVDVYLNGHYAYVACGEAGLQVIDIGQSSNPHTVGSFDTDGYARFVSVSGDIACVSDSTYGAAGGGVHFLDVSYFTHVDPTCLILEANPGLMSNFSIAINPVASMVYRTLASPTHFGAGGVIYINPQRWQDLDGDGRDDGIVDQDHMTRDSVRAEFMKLRAEPDSTRCPVIYLIGTGGLNSFQIGPGEPLSADTLLAWIEQIPVNPLNKLVIIIESCLSGSFIQYLNAPNRVIITSTNSSQVAEFNGPDLFSSYLWAKIDSGYTLSQGFICAKQEFESVHDGQTPQFEAVGDGNPNQATDYAAAGALKIVPDHLETLPGIIDPPEDRIWALGGPVCTLRCILTTEESILRVWYRILPENYAGDPPVATLPAGDMYATGDPNTYEAVYVDDHGFFQFSQNYYPAMYAINGSNHVLLPLVVNVYPVYETTARERELPAQFDLSNNYPNPFNSVTQFRLSLSVPGHVSFVVFNILGQKVDVLLDDYTSAGEHVITWDGTSAGISVSSGVYIARLESGDYVKSVKMVLLR